MDHRIIYEFYNSIYANFIHVFFSSINFVIDILFGPSPPPTLPIKNSSCFFTLFVWYSLYHFMDHGFIFHHHRYRRMKMWCGWHFFLAPHSFSSSYTKKNTNVRINEYQFNWFGFFSVCLFVGVTVRKKNNTTQHNTIYILRNFIYFFAVIIAKNAKNQRNNIQTLKCGKKFSFFDLWYSHTQTIIVVIICIPGLCVTVPKTRNNHFQIEWNNTNAIQL